MSQNQKSQQKNTTQEDTAVSTEAKDVSNEELAEATDDLLDEIDSVLETNAQEFVAEYIQKGGE